MGSLLLYGTSGLCILYHHSEEPESRDDSQDSSGASRHPKVPSMGTQCRLVARSLKRDRESGEVMPSLPEDYCSSKRALTTVELTRLSMGESL